MKFTSGVVFAALFAIEQVRGDIYMHAPRGSNNRNCRTDNNKERRNGNRVFDSQNNDNGGYSCPRAAPFACYKFVDNGGQFAQCSQQNANNPQGSKKNHLNAVGELVNPDATKHEDMYYYEGSELPISWTAQHGMGANDELYSELIVQYACEDTLQDNCANPQPGQSPYVANPNQQICTMRDGTPVRTQDGNNGLNAEATNRIPDDADDQDDMRYGRHETYAFYQQCKNRERNKGLWIADQNLNTNDARSTRQNPGANRNGLECPEESEYYPYWHHSPWKDVAVLADSTERCAFIQANSQNVVGKGRCECNGQCNGNGNQPNNAAACAAAGYTWVEDPAFGLPPPECKVAEYSRQNHLGNSAGSAQALAYNWTIPNLPANVDSMRCTLRLRYNMSSADKGTGTIEVARVGDASLNGDDKTPLYDNDENEEKTYMQVAGLPAGAALGFAINTNQYGRTFQDRSYVFEIRKRPQGVPAQAKIYNLNVRGKRGNIVQAYPAVEYDFVPSTLEVKTDDLIHVQWTGSDYNPNRDGNNGEAGPYAADNRNKDTTADRYNMVQMTNPTENRPGFDAAAYSMFGSGLNNAATYKKLTFLEQNIDGNECWTFQQLDNEYDNRDEREESYHNCMKLSGQAKTHFDGGLLIPGGGTTGSFKYADTRNNNFSNRQMQGRINVSPGAGGARLQSDGKGGFVKASGGADDTGSLPMILGIVGAAAVGIGGFTLYKRRQSSAGTAPQMQPQQQQQMQQGAAQVQAFNPGYNGTA